MGGLNIGDKWEDFQVGDLCGDNVLEEFRNARAYADTSYDQAIGFLNTMKAEVPGTPTINIDPIEDIQDPEIGGIGQITKPEEPDTSMVGYEAPGKPTLDSIILDTISGVPAFDVPGLSLNIPEQPDMMEISDPGIPDPISNIEYPSKPVYTLPSLPTLREASIPDAPSMTMPVFDAELPVDNLIAPTNIFSFSENPYSSTLLINTTNRINNDVVNGGTGLGADIEGAIWTRQQERDELALQEAKDRVSDEWAARGFSLPDGVLTAQLQELEKQYNDVRLTTSRDIAIEQAKLAQANTQFAVQQSIALESQLMNYASQMAQRQLEAAKALIDASVAIFNAQVAKYNARIEGYKAQAAVYESRIRGELAKAETFKAQIEAAKLTIDMDMAYVELYKAQLAGIQSMIDCYRAEMEGAKIKTECERLKVEAFKASIESYVARVNLNVAQFNCYESAIRGETAKAQIYGIQVEAYKARVDAAKIEASIATENARVKSEMQKNTVAMYATDVEAYKAKIEAEKTRIEAIIEAYKGQIEAYKAESQVEMTEVEAAVKVYEGKIKEAAMTAEANIKEAEVNLQAFMETCKLRTMISNDAAKIAAQLAASAMAATQASVGLSESDGKHKSMVANMSESESSSKSYNSSYSSNSSTSTNTNYNYNY